jgi:large subunit ribosomal protein L4
MAEKKTVSVKVVNMAGEEVSKVNLSANVFAVEPHTQAMFNAVQVEQSNRRQGTAKTKVRHEVSGGGKKPWRQKGTGRARAGTTRSPIWVGGGTVFGPDGNQNWKLSQNKKEYALAKKSALSLKAKEGLVVVDAIAFSEPKTKVANKFFEAIKATSKVLMVVNEIDENTFASTRNLGWVKVVTSDNLSVLDILNVDYLVASKDAIKKIEEDLK